MIVMTAKFAIIVQQSEKNILSGKRQNIRQIT